MLTLIKIVFTKGELLRGKICDSDVLFSLHMFFQKLSNKKVVDTFEGKVNYEVASAAETVIITLSNVSLSSLPIV